MLGSGLDVKVVVDTTKAFMLGKLFYQRQKQKEGVRFVLTSAN